MRTASDVLMRIMGMKKVADFIKQSRNSESDSGELKPELLKVLPKLSAVEQSELLKAIGTTLRGIDTWSNHIANSLDNEPRQIFTYYRDGIDINTEYNKPVYKNQALFEIVSDCLSGTGRSVIEKITYYWSQTEPLECTLVKKHIINEIKNTDSPEEIADALLTGESNLKIEAMTLHHTISYDLICRLLFCCDKAKEHAKYQNNNIAHQQLEKQYKQ